MLTHECACKGNDPQLRHALLNNTPLHVCARVYRVGADGGDLAGLAVCHGQPSESEAHAGVGPERQGRTHHTQARGKVVPAIRLHVC